MSTGAQRCLKSILWDEPPQIPLVPVRRGEPAASQEAAALNTVFQALVQAALADAAAGAQDDEAEGEAADDAGEGERDMPFLQATDA